MFFRLNRYSHLLYAASKSECLIFLTKSSLWTKQKIPNFFYIKRFDDEIATEHFKIKGQSKTSYLNAIWSKLVTQTIHYSHEWCWALLNNCHMYAVYLLFRTSTRLLFVCQPLSSSHASDVFVILLFYNIFAIDFDFNLLISIRHIFCPKHTNCSIRDSDKRIKTNTYCDLFLAACHYLCTSIIIIWIFFFLKSD